mmetsp:Transcript_16900/g.52515  ORF Transcript_16900/g.52515 Transcript_16900/m.52515 type:complete len:227 (-) Transcript_16900:2029-2709(-)
MRRRARRSRSPSRARPSTSPSRACCTGRCARCSRAWTRAARSWARSCTSPPRSTSAPSCSGPASAESPTGPFNSRASPPSCGRRRPAQRARASTCGAGTRRPPRARAWASTRRVLSRCSAPTFCSSCPLALQTVTSDGSACRASRRRARATSGAAMRASRGRTRPRSGRAARQWARKSASSPSLRASSRRARRPPALMAAAPLLPGLRSSGPTRPSSSARRISPPG